MTGVSLRGPGGKVVASSQTKQLGLAAALAAVVTACGAPAIPPAFLEETVEETQYRIAPADLLSVRVWKNQELSIDSAPVLPDGTLTVPLAGTVSAKGLTAAELEDVLSEELSEYISAPEVAVIVTQVNSKRVSVIGEVNRSGPQPLAVNTRLVDALSNAGGFSPYANRKKVKIIRRTPEGEVEYTFNYDAFEAGRAPGSNVRLQAGDVIVVPD